MTEARTKVEPLLSVPYRAEWSGEFKQMEAAEARMARMFGVSLVLIGLFLYMALRSFLDAGVVFANVLAMGARVVGIGLAEDILHTFISTSFEGGRHADRVAQLMALEEEF